MADKEANVWKKLKELGGQRILLDRFECHYPLGIPDVYFVTTGSPLCTGWIELKNVPHWPKRPKTPVRLDHFTASQRLWIYLHGSLGVPIFILLGTPGNGLLLFDWRAAFCLGSWTKGELLAKARWRWSVGVADTDLIDVIEAPIPKSEICDIKPRTFQV